MNAFYHVLRMPVVGLCALATVFAYADPVQVGDFYYDIDQAGKTATLARNAAYQSMSSAVIPGAITVDGTEFTVTAVAQQAFQQCKSLTSVSIGEGVTSIGKWAFYECTALEDVSLPSTLTTILASGFSKCSAIKTLSLPANLTEIGSYAFGTCTSLVEVTLPAGLKALNAAVFPNCSNLTTVNFNDKLEIISENAFDNCGLTKVVLPSSLTELGYGAFSNCQKLKEVVAPASLTTIGETAFYKCGQLSTIHLPDGLKSIGMGAFYECVSLTGIVLPEGLESIDANGFYGCTSLKTMKIPASMTSLSNNTFYNCSGLTEIVLHDGITSIGKSAFYGCSALPSVKLPAGLTTISQALFSRCSSLESIDIPETVTVIGENAFYYCSSLKQISISKNVESIGVSAMLGCTSLQNITVAEGNSAYCDVDGVLLTKDKTRLLAYPGGRKDVYVMPETVTEIDGYVFNSNPNIQGIVFSKNLRTIGISAFYQASGLTSVELPESLEQIGDFAFFMNMNIKSVKLPSSDVRIGNNALSLTGISELVFPEGITSIGVSGEAGVSVMGSCSALKWVSLPSTLATFSPLGAGCGSLTTVYSFSTEPPVLVGENVVELSAVVKVPVGSADAYADAWKSLYPGLTYEEALPGAPSVTIGKNDATVSWEVYSDDLYTGTPVRYEIALHSGDTVTDETIEGDDAVSSGLMSHTFKNLAPDGVYGYEIKGYSSAGQVTALYKGEIDMAGAGIGNIATEEAGVVGRRYYDLGGRVVDNPSAHGVYIVRTTYTDGSVTTEKHVVK